MPSPLPLIVGFGGYNAAGRSSGHLAYRRMVLETLSQDKQIETLSALAKMMRIDPKSETLHKQVLDGTLVRKIEPQFFDPDHTPVNKRYTLEYPNSQAATFTVSRRNLPATLPDHWRTEPLDEEGRYFRVTLEGEQDFKVEMAEPCAVKTAGQLPSGFDPASHYRSLHHPRGLQLAVLGASDAVHSAGIQWRDIASSVAADQISVYSASIMSQLDTTGFGGLFRGRLDGVRTSSKQVALGLNTMPADFINAYVLGSMGYTGGTAGACATFLYNLRQGVEDIRSGRCKVSLVGASEAPILPEIIDGYAAMGALATEDALCRLDAAQVADHRRASRPFGDNCGFTIAESAQYVMLMADDLAVELGARVFGAVPGVYVNADGFKKSISAPGAGNYLTMAKAVGLANTLLGETSVRQRSLIQAHGSSTPQNRVTESKIFDRVAEAFGIGAWPVAAVKAFLGHSLAAASGDQLAATLGVFADGIVPGIKTTSEIAPDVFSGRLDFALADRQVEPGAIDVAFLNSKGFGGNNATATLFSPQIAEEYLIRRYGQKGMHAYRKRRELPAEAAEAYISRVNAGACEAIYQFGENLPDEEAIELDADQVRPQPGAAPISLVLKEGYETLEKS